MLMRYNRILLTSALFQIYEKHYDPHQEGVYSERGHFIIDKYSGGATEFNVFALKPYNNFLKSMDLQDRRGNMYNSMMDSMANFHIFSIYNVPFKSVSKLTPRLDYDSLNYIMLCHLRCQITQLIF